MKKTFLIAFVLYGCSTPVPIQPKFPQVPDVLMETCQQLKEMNPETPTLKHLLTTVVDNYTLYYECAEKVEAWMSWYKQQKKIFEGK